MHAGPPGVRSSLVRRFALLLATLAMVAGAFPNVAAAVQGRTFVDESGVAVAGYDPVSYFQAEGPLRGSASHEVEHDGALYRFANEENAAKFRAEPERYMPQYGGFCAYGMTFGSRSPVDPLAYRIHDDKLYIMINQGTTAMWQSRKKVAIPKADAAWRHLRSLGE